VATRSASGGNDAVAVRRGQSRRRERKALQPGEARPAPERPVVQQLVQRSGKLRSVILQQLRQHHQKHHRRKPGRKLLLSGHLGWTRTWKKCGGLAASSGRAAVDLKRVGVSGKSADKVGSLHVDSHGLGSDVDRAAAAVLEYWS
jgi:hypothetical protein